MQLVPELTRAELDADLDHPDMGIVFAVSPVDGNLCPDCGGDLGDAFGFGLHRTCTGCETTFLGAGEDAAHG
ncbi:MAG TPA: hypothetical protein VF628_11235 [Allosphingosinicella sp.]|jgi:hypothetical protein